MTTAVPDLASSSILCILLATAIWTVAQFLFSTRALRSVPGPFLAKWSRAWMVYHSCKGDMHRKMIELHEQYGDLVRTGPNEVSVSDSAAVKTIYGAGSKFCKSDWYSVWQGRRTFDLFGERDEKIHRSQRMLVSAAYSLESLLELEPYVDDALSCLLSSLRGFGGQVVRMDKWAQLFAFDVVGEVTFSKRFGFMDAGQDDGSFAQISSALQSASWVGQVPWFYWAQDRLEPLIGNHLGIRARHGSLRTFAAREVARRKDRGSDHVDLLDKLLKVQRARPLEMNDMAVLSMATSNIFAGSDTTAISISAVLYYLCRYPGCKAKLLEDITSVLGSDVPRSSVSYASAKKMTYLQACIQEALRLHPAVGMSLPRVVPEGGLTVSGKHIPAGTVVGVNPWVLHRDKDIFGEDADDFRPERWLAEDHGQLNRFFFAFGSGARLCIGKNLSLLEISKLIPTLLLTFDIALASPKDSIGENCWWFVKIDNLNMTLRPRGEVSNA